jgi:hypothetical protein
MKMTDKKLYDDCFYVEQKKYGLWDSYDLEGKSLITSLTEEQCVTATRWYCKQIQENTLDKTVEKTYSSEVGGKL